MRHILSAGLGLVLITPAMTAPVFAATRESAMNVVFDAPASDLVLFVAAALVASAIAMVIAYRCNQD